MLLGAPAKHAARCGVPGVCCGLAEAINTGPLEATIHNLGKEIDFKTKEGQDLQCRWITKQTELVALQVSLMCSA